MQRISPPTRYALFPAWPDSIEDWCQRAGALSKEKGFTFHERDTAATLGLADLVVRMVHIALPAIEGARNRAEANLIQVDREVAQLSPQAQYKLSCIALLISECLEYAECIISGEPDLFSPEGKPQGPSVEVADIALRLFDHCSKEGIDLVHFLRVKHEYNRSRPYKHGKKA